MIRFLEDWVACVLISTVKDVLCPRLSSACSTCDHACVFAVVYLCPDQLSVNSDIESNRETNTDRDPYDRNESETFSVWGVKTLIWSVEIELTSG